MTRKVEVARIVEPKFLTLTGKPANQVAFKVIRDDKGETTMTAAHIQRKRTRRSDGLVSIEFDISLDDEAIKNAMGDWGISEYSLETTSDKKIVRCSDAGEADTMRINLAGGSVATILKPISTATDNVKRNVAVAAVEFAADYFPDIADVEAWCKRNSVDFSSVAPQNGDTKITAQRNVKVGPEDETRKVEVDAGVNFVVTRADEADVPDGFIAVVNDAAYGSWGWGQLDFAATMADVEFCKVSEEAVYTLNRVVERILFYSDLPISVRKELIANAAAQFSNFIVTLMDALPARVVIANRSDQHKEKDMSKQKQDGQPVERQDVAGQQQENKDSGAAAGAAPAADTVSRADVEKLIGDAVGGLSKQIADLTAAVASTTQRSDAADTKAEADTAAADAGTKAEGGETGETLREVLRSVQALTDAVKTVNERVSAVEGETVVRSDAGDGKQTTQRKDAFKGIFGQGKKA